MLLQNFLVYDVMIKWLFPEQSKELKEKLKRFLLIIIFLPWAAVNNAAPDLLLYLSTAHIFQLTSQSEDQWHRFFVIPGEP